MKTLDVIDFHAPAEFELPTLKPGMCIVLWTDKGPGGPCGQSMSITCPWAGILIFPDYDTMKSHLDAGCGRRGSRRDMRWFQVGDSGTGRLHISVPE